MLWQLRRPFKHKIINKYLKAKNNINLLDVGCWRFSAHEFKRSFPDCRYYGVDVLPADDAARNKMEDFYQLDLTSDDLSQIPDNFFDIIVVSHVIEHLEDGCSVIQRLDSKIKPGGLLYIEYPAVKSLRLPSRPDTLNFCDDPSHKTLYSLQQLGNLLLKSRYKIFKAGPRRDKFRIIMMLPTMLWQLLRYRKIFSYVFWDALGFAEYIIAEKKDEHGRSGS